MFKCPADSTLRQGELSVILDGSPVRLPEARRSLTAVLSYLETLAFEQQRILFRLKIDGQPVNLSQPEIAAGHFSRIESETICLDELPLELLNTAAGQTAAVRAEVAAAVAQVLINEGNISQELWWKLSRQLKEPLVTLSLLPADAWGPACGSASFSQLRKWQLQQLAAIIHDVDAAGETGDTLRLSDMLETRVLKWLDMLQETIALWYDTVSAGLQKDPVRRFA